MKVCSRMWFRFSLGIWTSLDTKPGERTCALLPGMSRSHRTLGKEGWNMEQIRAVGFLVWHGHGAGDPLLRKVSQFSDKPAGDKDPLCNTA